MITMPPLLRPRELDGTTRANLDRLGVAYIVVAVLYTLILSVELFFLHRRREAFCLQIRNIKIVFAAVLMLHIYLILVLLVYPWNGLFPCSAEFWIMSVFLPSGMAFFQGKFEVRRKVRCILSSYSMQCQGAHGLREPAPYDTQLSGGCAQEADVVYPTRPSRSVARSRCGEESILWYFGRTSPFGMSCCSASMCIPLTAAVPARYHAVLRLSPLSRCVRFLRSSY